MEGEKETKQYLSIGKISDEQKEKAQRNAKLQCISRNAKEIMEVPEVGTDNLTEMWEKANNVIPKKVIDFWTSKLIWESGPNPPYIHTQFINNRKNGRLELILHNEFLNIQLELALTTDDKISMLDAINKENNRIKSALEKDKVKEYTPNEKLYCDKVTSKEKGDGIEWDYIKDGKSLGTAFMSYKELYEIQIGKDSSKCQFCDSTATRKYRPRYEANAIYLCKQHEKYIQRVSQREHGILEEV